MLWHALSVLRCPLYVLVGRLLGDDRDRLILVLRQQVLILQRQLGKRPPLTRSERLALVLACAGLARRRLLEALVIVKPDTLVRWHRKLVRRRWNFWPGRRPGRPPVDAEAERLVLQLARENSRWGLTKIARGMGKLGFRYFGRSTVRRRGLSWFDFVGH